MKPTKILIFVQDGVLADTRLVPNNVPPRIALKSFAEEHLKNLDHLNPTHENFQDVTLDEALEKRYVESGDGLDTVYYREV